MVLLNPVPVFGAPKKYQYKRTLVKLYSLQLSKKWQQKHVLLLPYYSEESGYGGRGTLIRGGAWLDSLA